MFLLPGKARSASSDSQHEWKSHAETARRPDLDSLSIRVARLDAELSIASRRSAEVEGAIANAEQWVDRKLQALSTHLQDQLDSRVEELVRGLVANMVSRNLTGSIEAAPCEQKLAQEKEDLVREGDRSNGKSKYKLRLRTTKRVVTSKHCRQPSSDASGTTTTSKSGSTTPDTETDALEAANASRPSASAAPVQGEELQQVLERRRQSESSVSSGHISDAADSLADCDKHDKHRSSNPARASAEQHTGGNPLEHVTRLESLSSQSKLGARRPMRRKLRSSSRKQSIDGSLDTDQQEPLQALVIPASEHDLAQIAGTSVHLGTPSNRLPDGMHKSSGASQIQAGLAKCLSYQDEVAC